MHDNYLINLNKRKICFIFNFNKNAKIYEYYVRNIKRLILNINFYMFYCFINFVLLIFIFVLIQ